jgi:transposase
LSVQVTKVCRSAAAAARIAGQAALDAVDLLTRYRDLAAAGLIANLYRRTATAADARRLARRLRGYEDMILRFATRPDLEIFSNNEAERAIRPTKVQQRSSGGCWRTPQGLAEFALVQSYLSTAAKWGISKLDALRGLFTGQAWLPPALEPA